MARRGDHRLVMPPKIFISYRRADSASIVGRIYDRLVARYGPGAVFLDVDSVPVAADFREKIRESLAQTGVMLAVVGRQWRGSDGQTVRLMASEDHVRVEIETALAAGIPTVPLLVDGAAMPTPAEVPRSLERFPFMNAAVVDSGRDFHHHLDRLIESLDKMLGVAQRPRARGDPSRRYYFAIIAAFAVLPSAGAYIGFAPPWPPGAGAIAGGLAAAAFALTENRSGTAQMRAPFLTIASICGLLAICGYLLSTSLFVYAAPNGERFVKGLMCTPEARAVYKAKCPSLGIDELRGAEYESDRLWTLTSIGVVKVALNMLWCAIFVAAAMVAAGIYATAASKVPMALERKEA